MAAGASICLQSFHPRENNLIHLESFETTSRKPGSYTVDCSSVSSSRSGTEQTQRKILKIHKQKQVLAQTVQSFISYTY